MKWGWKSLLMAGAMCAGLTLSAHAEDRALIIGIENYKYFGHLPGINMDIEAAKDFAAKMGFKNPIVLVDQQATKAGIEAALRKVLDERSSPEDRVFIYYSGHGTGIPDQNGDEADGQDEALVAYDARPARGSFEGLVIDDTIGEILDQSQSQHIVMIVDACQSGTVDRSVGLDRGVAGAFTGIVKHVEWPVDRSHAKSPRRSAHSTSPLRSIAVEGSDAGPEKYVLLSAAADNEYAVATDSGSLFTIGLTKAFSDLGKTATPKLLIEKSKAFVAENVPAERRFTPQLHGDAGLQNATLNLADTSSGGGANWRRVAALAETQSALPTSGLKSSYKVRDQINFTLDLPSDGYLNIVSVGADDSVTVLFPNKYHRDNQVKAGTLSMPAGGGLPFKLVGRDPGQTLIVAFLTKERLNLLETAADSRGLAPLATPSLAGLSNAKKIADRSIEVVGGDSTAWAVKLVTEITQH